LFAPIRQSVAAEDPVGGLFKNHGQKNGPGRCSSKGVVADVGQRLVRLARSIQRQNASYLGGLTNMSKLGTLLLWLTLTTAGLAEQYTLDAAHSEVTFRVHQYVSVVTGKFKDFSGTVTFDPGQWERSHVEATISVKSIDTGIAARDHHLLAADFFDAEKYPTITFKSTSVHLTGERTAEVHGDLTMHGKAVPEVIRIELQSPAKNGGEPSVWTVSAHLRRSAFGLKWNPVVEATSGISDEIEIQMRIVTQAH
jgi:polyisoprenoid-binding protein YceI